MTKIYFYTAIRNAMCILLTAGLLFSCGQIEPFEAEEINHLSLKAISDAPDCKSECIKPGSGSYFEKTGSLSQRSGINTKVVSYAAYNTADAFIVEVAYHITTGPAKGKASITINIEGVKKEFKNIPSGGTVSHSIPLPDGWIGCESVGFQISQTGMGKPIHFNEEYGLIPICIDDTAIEYVVMGNQIWSKYNLNVDRYRNGDPIPEIQDDLAWSEATTGAWSYYRNNPAYEEQFGRLYNFAAVTDPRNLAPEGWRIPTQDDWNELLDYMGTDFQEEEYKEKYQDFASYIGIVPPYGSIESIMSSYRHWWSSTPHTIEGRAHTYVVSLDRYYGLTVHSSNARINWRLAVRLIKE